MINPTKRQLAQRYLIEFSGGQISDDIRIDERFVIQEINQAIAFVAKGSALESANSDGIFYANDQFIVPYRNVPIVSSSDNEFKYSVLPDIPIGIPKGRGLVSVIPPLGSENSLKPISVRQVPFLFHQAQIPKVIFYWIEGGNVNYYPQPSFNKVSMKIISSGVSDIDTPLSVPPETLIQIKAQVEKSLSLLFQVKPDSINDSEPQ